MEAFTPSQKEVMNRYIDAALKHLVAQAGGSVDIGMDEAEGAGDYTLEMMYIPSSNSFKLITKVVNIYDKMEPIRAQ